MTQENIVAGIAAASVLSALAMFVTDQWYFSKDAERARREISRFPLFAVRGRLVCLVAEGKIKEEDPAWQSIYQRVNFFLRMDQNLNLLDLVSRYIRSQIEADKTPQLREHVEQTLKLEREAAQRIPEYGRIVEETRDAMMHLVRMRTTRFHRATVLLLSVMLGIAATALSGGVRAAQVARRAVTKPSSENLLTWQTVDSRYTTA